jgi:tripartite-type tricarboxylate transporter receptor subunit TctC
MQVQHRRKLMPKFAVVAVLAATLSVFAVAAAHAQSAATKLTVIYPFAAGGSADGAGRLVTEELGRKLGRSTVFENRGGGGGRIGIKAAMSAPPDGSVLLFAPMGPMAIQPSFHPDMGFDVFKDFKPVSLVASFDLALAAGPGLPARTLTEAVEWMKANPGKAAAGVPGAGGLPHFFTFMLADAAKVEIKPIVYRGSGAAVNDAVAGHLPLVMLPASESLSQHRAGKLRVLATSGAERSADLPDVPTFSEAGLPDSGRRLVRNVRSSQHARCKGERVECCPARCAGEPGASQQDRRHGL